VLELYQAAEKRGVWTLSWRAFWAIMGAILLDNR